MNFENQRKFKTRLILQHGKHWIKQIEEKRYLLCLFSKKWNMYQFFYGSYIKPLKNKLAKRIAEENQLDLFEKKITNEISLPIYKH